jgi:hypothetical protein
MLRKLVLVIAAVILLPFANDVMADADFGIQGSWSKTENANSGDWGVGARVAFGGSVRGIIAFDYFFVNADDLFDTDDATSEDFDLKFFELNGNVVYEFSGDSVRPYIGGGAGLARRSLDDIEDVFDDDRTELGVNVLGGVEFGSGGVKPFVEVRWTFYPDDEGDIGDVFDIGDAIQFGDRFIFTAGILF